MMEVDDCRVLILILVLMTRTMSYAAEPQDKPICYSEFKQSASSTVFKQTKCTDGTYAFRFESAEFVLSELLTINTHAPFHDDEQITDTVPSDADDNGFTTTFINYYNFQIITENNTNVTTPNFPSNYANSMTLWFSIRPPDKLSRVSLTFTSFKLEESSECTADSVQLVGTLDPSPRCGSITPSPVVSLGNVLEIYFKSDSKTTSTGFEAAINFLDPDPEYRTSAPGICGSVDLQSNGSADLNSPYIGQKNIQCGYIIHADVGKTIQLSFRWFYLENCGSRDTNFDFQPSISEYEIPEVILGIEHEIDVETCLCDSLQIFDGYDAQAPNLTDRICSLKTPKITPTSTGNVMYIYFETDSEVRTGGFGISLSVI